MEQSFQELDLHGERAAVRGNPSFVWRAGQDRRLNMIRQWGGPFGGSLGEVLVDGCGVGMYVRALLPYARAVYGIDIEGEHLTRAAAANPQAHLQLAMGEALPYPADFFDLVLSHEVLEHVSNDRLAAAEMVRVLKPGGRAVIFAPNRLYPFETHGHYWRGEYHFGNTPFINYLPDGLRNRLAPHVRAYTRRDILDLFLGQPVKVVYFTQIFPGYDNIVYRNPRLGAWLKRITYTLELTPLTAFGISHFLVVEKVTG
ncbi:MAG: class I SAM-dependent methyltransferase [Caldilineaceae bacterium]|nr:class I SAM-dependent methyltransferase [Caldilineaceae bacterium]MCB9139677.1 class I SAM-dependent methyltransferase [Caldilineaceae bacterium]